MDADTLHTLALTLGAGWAAGLNLYAAVLVLGGLGALGRVELPPELAFLSDPWVLAVAALLFVLEFLADKVPWVDSLWDALHTFIRIPAGALLAAGAAQGMDAGLLGTAAGLAAGGGLAAASHATKAGARALINTSPEPASNWTASVTEDLAVVGGLWTALNHPWLFLLLLLLFLLLAAWLLPKAWRLMRAGGRTLRGWLRPGGSPSSRSPEESP